jgi:hypothetical protein
MFGSYSGIYIFEPEKIKQNAYAPPVVITGLKINGADIRPGEKNSFLAESITLTKSIRLKHDQNSFNLILNLPCLVSSRRISTNIPTILKAMRKNGIR